MCPGPEASTTSTSNGEKPCAERDQSIFDGVFEKLEAEENKIATLLSHEAQKDIKVSDGKMASRIGTSTLWKRSKFGFNQTNTSEGVCFLLLSRVRAWVKWWHNDALEQHHVKPVHIAPHLERKACER